MSRRNDGTHSNAGGTTRAFPSVDSRRRRSVSDARYQICDSEVYFSLDLIVYFYVYAEYLRWNLT